MRRASGVLVLGPILGLTALAACSSLSAPQPEIDPDADSDSPDVLYRSDAFTVTAATVEQGPFRAVAVSRDRIESSYQRAAVEVNFKFSLNGEDNELVPGEDHRIYLRPPSDGSGRIVTPVYSFGVLDPPETPEPRAVSELSEAGPVEVTFRVDLRPALAAWAAGESFQPPGHPSMDPIPPGAFEGVYVVGNVEPLSWDFGALVPGSRRELHDPDGDGVYEVTLPFEAAFARPLIGDGVGKGPDARALWERSRNLSRFPTHRSPHPLVDALHHLALEELLELTREDGTSTALDAGGRWPGVWTRDQAWSALLGTVLAWPEAVRAGLESGIGDDGRIRQDSGTGGSWPVSTDRVAWTLAAWELYAVTGDREWLRTAYDAARLSAEDDLAVAFDPETGLFRGESTFLDWREQSYPDWMEPADIGASQALGTNVLHFAAYRVLARMARELSGSLGEPEEAERWEGVAERVRAGLDEHLWREDSGWYGGFRYGRAFPALSERPEMLGEALAVVLGAADEERSRRMLASLPVVPFGVPSFHPYIPDQPPYHNAGVWPQVVGFHAWAAAEAGNGAAAEHSLASLLRGAGLFLTNKENWVAATGHFEGTEVNSDRFQASAAAQLAIVYRVLFGIRLRSDENGDRLELRPFVPRAWGGTRTLEGLRYRDAVLDLTVRGHGTAIREARLDGRTVPRAEVPAELTGEHTLEVVLDGEPAGGGLALAEDLATPETPRARLDPDAGRIRWRPVPGAVRYRVVRNGAPVLTVDGTSAPLLGQAGPGGLPPGVAEYQVQALAEDGLASFLSEPLRFGLEGGSEGDLYTLEPGPARLDADRNRRLDFRLTVDASGWYAVDARYANGAGPVSYGYGAACRGLEVDGRAAGTLLLPQRGGDRWDDTGHSNPIRVRLEAGDHVLSVVRRPADRGEALLHHLRVARLATGTPPTEER